MKARQIMPLVKETELLQELVNLVRLYVVNIFFGGD